jgi:excisionase family DNA binding protein
MAEPVAILTAAEVARRLDVPLSTVREWLWSGRLPGYRSGGNAAGWRIPEAALQRFMQSTRPAPGRR